MSDKSTTYYFVNQAKCFHTENWKAKYLSCWFSMNLHVHSTRYFNPKRISGLHKSLTTRLIQLSEINPSNFVRGASKIKTSKTLEIVPTGDNFWRWVQCCSLNFGMVTPCNHILFSFYWRLIQQSFFKWWKQFYMTKRAIN